METTWFLTSLTSWVWNCVVQFQLSKRGTLHCSGLLINLLLDTKPLYKIRTRLLTITMTTLNYSTCFVHFSRKITNEIRSLSCRHSGSNFCPCSTPFNDSHTLSISAEFIPNRSLVVPRTPCHINPSNKSILTVTHRRNRIHSFRDNLPRVSIKCICPVP